MFEESQAVRPMTEEEIKFEKMTKQIEKLEKIVGALAVTNFLTQHEDGDEEVRDESVERVNRFARQFKDQYINDKKIAELEEQKRQLDMKIEGLKWGVATYKTAGRYATGLGNAILNTQNTITSSILSTPMNTSIALDQALNTDLHREYRDAFALSAAKAEAAAIVKESK